MRITLEDAARQVGHIADYWLPLKIKYDQTPGLAVGIVYKGKLVFARGFGFANVATKELVTSTTKFHVASISKMFTAVAVMQLVERGKLRLDDRIADYVDWFKLKAKRGDAAHITVRQLLSHGAGVFRDGDTPHWETGAFPKDLAHAPSERMFPLEHLSGFKYSNFGYALLGAVVETASGQTYRSYIEENILLPLDMHDTHVDYTSEVHNLAQGYGRVVPGASREVFSVHETFAYAPATGYISNVDDLATFLSALSTKRRGSAILQKRSLREMVKPHEKNEDDAYGLGLDVVTMHERSVVGHSGGFNGYISEAVIDPENEIGVIVLSNAIGSSACEIAFGILDAVYTLVDKQKDFASTVKTAFEKYEGVYRSSWGDSTVVRCGDVLISFSPTDDEPLKKVTILKPTKNENEFVISTPYLTHSHAELARFSTIVDGRAQTVLFGATPSTRVGE